MKKRIKRLQGTSYVVSLEAQDVLGQGSFGRVVRAYDLDNREDQLVAKIMDITSNSKMECLKQELNVLENFHSDHQNLVHYKRKKLFSQKACYIIMECCNGGTLEDKMKKKLPSEAEIVDFLSQFCSGYRELYKQGIIHRDLKPANIMLHDRTYKITDFGLAKIVTSLNDNMSFKGTPLYMPPEMIQEEAGADAKIDMWALGIILYRMLYGKFPFLIQNKKYDRDTAFSDIISNQLTLPNLPIRSPEIIQLVKAMLEKKPKDRISWDALFQHKLINMTDLLINPMQQQQQQQPIRSMLSSSVFIQQMVTQKVSLIKVMPFKEVKLKMDIKQIITDVDIKQQIAHQDDEQKFILDGMIKDLNSKIATQKLIREIEDKLLFIREQVFFIDKAALRIYRLPQFDQLVLYSIVSNLLDRALLKASDLKSLSMLTKEQQTKYKESINCEVFMQMINQDYNGLLDFKEEVSKKLPKKIENPGQIFMKSIKNLQLYNKQVYIASKYLIAIENLDEFSQDLQQYEDFWKYYEEIELTTDDDAVTLLMKLL